MVPINFSKLPGYPGITRALGSGKAWCDHALILASIHKPSPRSASKARGLSSRLGSNRKECTRFRLGYEVASHFVMP